MARSTVDDKLLLESEVITSRKNTRHARDREAGAANGPRLGRRESEPHSSEITYLHDVLTTNFPEDRVMWDLHHYFTVGESEIDIQFDLSYFRNFHLPYGLSSYNASQFDNRVPTMAVNILSISTYKVDIDDHAVQSCSLGIPVYVVFNPYLPLPSPLDAPFLRVHYLEDPTNPTYKIRELKDACATEEELERRPTTPLDPTKLVDVGEERIPFLLGIITLRRKFEGELPWYRMILVNRETLTALPTQAERERQRAEQERQRAERLERELQELKKRLAMNNST